MLLVEPSTHGVVRAKGCGNQPPLTDNLHGVGDLRTGHLEVLAQLLGPASRWGFLESSGPTELTLAAPLTAEQPEQLAPGRDALVEALEPEELVRCMQVLVGC